MREMHRPAARGHNNCTALTWVTVAHTRGVRPHGLTACHAALLPAGGAGSFWRRKWVAVHRYVAGHPEVGAFVVTDVYDVRVNPWPTARVLERLGALAPRTSLLLAAEDTCWVGAVCSRAQVAAFERTGLTTGRRFLHSQFAGARAPVLRMLTWGIRSGWQDDMRIMYEYVRAFPQRATLDAAGAVFGSLAFAEFNGTDAGPYVCWEGRCGASVRARACVRGAAGDTCIRTEGGASRAACPLLWHGNGMLSHAFLDAHPRCVRMLGRLK